MTSVISKCVSILVVTPLKTSLTFNTLLVENKDNEQILITYPKLFQACGNHNFIVVLIEPRSLCCTDPGLVLTVSGTPVLVGVLAGEAKGDVGVTPGLLRVAVVGVGDMGWPPTSCAASREPGVLPPPSLLPDFYNANRCHVQKLSCTRSVLDERNS